jgi:hypothetical protein
MPIALDPSQTVDVVLVLDSEKPEPRPTFVCRHLTCRDAIEVGRLTAEAYEKDRGGDVNVDINDLLNRVLAIQLVTWRNIDKPFAVGSFDDVLSPMEKWELIGRATELVKIDFLLKKKSLLRRRSATENSAKNASASESATSLPAATTGSTSPASSAAETVP